MDMNAMKILVVEDDKNSRATIRAMLLEMGVTQVFESKDGSDADIFMDIDAVDIDIVISDWNMPNKTGIEFLKKLRQMRPTLPFIMVTGRADSNSVQDAVQAGVTGYIRKPFSMQELETKIKTISKKTVL